MPSTYASIKRQISQLEKKAAALRKAATAKVIATIKAQIAEFDLTAQELFGRGEKTPARKGDGTRRTRAKAPPKYRDPESGKTWNGIGKPPRWIASAKSRDDFLIDGGKAKRARTKPVASKAVSKKAAPSAEVARGASRARKAEPKKAAAGKSAARKDDAPRPRKAAKKSAPQPAGAAAPASATGVFA